MIEEIFIYTKLDEGYSISLSDAAKDIEDLEIIIPALHDNSPIIKVEDCGFQKSKIKIVKFENNNSALLFEIGK
jgi:hypothetical protein